MAGWVVNVRYDPDKDGMREVATGFHLRRAVTQIANSAKAFAESTSPSGFEGYELQFEGDVECIPDIPRRRRGEPMERVAAALINQSRLAVLVEVGSSNSEEYRILTRTLRNIELQGKLA